MSGGRSAHRRRLTDRGRGRSPVTRSADRQPAGHRSGAPASSGPAPRSARSMPSSSTSRWVTSRSNCGPSAETSTPCSRAAAATAGRVGHRQHHDVGLGQRRVDAQLGGQPGGPGVVVGQPFDVVLQGETAGRGQDADLPHAAAVALAPDPGLGDPLGRGHQHRADRRAQPLGQADRHGVEAGGQLGQRCPEATWAFHSRAPSRCRPRPCARASCCTARTAVQRLHRAAAEVVGVLHRDRGGRDQVRPGVRGDQLGHRVGDRAGRASARQVRVVMPENTAAAPSSARTTCAVWSHTSSCAGFHQQPQAQAGWPASPDGVNRPAS